VCCQYANEHHYRGGARFRARVSGNGHPAPACAADLADVADGCPAAESLLLLASELATNAILHSRSGHPERTFTVRATLSPGAYARVEVEDQGGPWTAREHDVERGRGLAIVAAVAGDGNWGIEGDAACRVAWFRLDWQQL
jgi:anti-sigma regulatory factor (Ser/Thr protein kinase)